MKRSGELTVITGPMYAGKTSETLRRLFNEAHINQSCLYINHSSDDRSTSSYSTHNPLYKEKLSMMSHVKLITVSSMDSVTDIMDYDIVAIDEMQFFTMDDALFVQRLVEKYGKTVIISGLNLDFEREPFPTVQTLMMLADDVVMLHAYCENCVPKRSKAIFSHRKSNSKEKVLVGGKKDYIPVCRECYLRLNEEEEVCEDEDSNDKIDECVIAFIAGKMGYDITSKDEYYREKISTSLAKRGGDITGTLMDLCFMEAY